VRRDFSNGFLVAEIFSRYYQNDIFMHRCAHPRALPGCESLCTTSPPAADHHTSFDNGSSVKRKLDNWQQLNKFFYKHSIPLTDKDVIEALVHCKDKAGVTFVCNMYKFLTQRDVPDMDSLRITTDDEAPYFARPTATRLVKESIKDSELVTTMKSHHSAANKASELIASHAASQRADRTNDPERFNTQTARMERGPPPKPSGEEQTAPLIEFKEVNVKPVDRSVAQIRAAKDQSSRLMTEGSSVGAAGMSLSDAGRAPPSVTQGRTCADVLSAVVARVMEEVAEFPTIPADGEGGILAAFTDAVHNHDLTPDDVVAFCDGLINSAEDARSLAAVVLGNPKEFWAFFSTVAAIMDGSDSPFVMEAVEQMLLVVGSEVTAVDAAQGRSLFVEYALPMVLPMLQAPVRRRAALVGMYAFSENDVLTHARLIKTLQDSLGGGDDGTFIHCAAVLVTIEAQFNDDLLDVYLYYAIMGSAMPEPSVRAAALSMLPTIIAQNPTLVINMLGRLEPMVEDSWWEVQAQLLQACAALLGRIDAVDGSAPRVYSIAESIMTKYFSSTNIQKIGLTCLAGCIGSHPTLCKAYVRCLMNLPHHFRLNLLGPVEDVEPVNVLGNTAANYEIDSLPARWDSLKVAAAAVDIIFEGEEMRGNLEKEHVAVIQAAVSSLSGEMDGVSLAAWSDLFTSMKDYFYISLVDEELCEGAVAIFDSFLSFLPSQVVINTFPTLLSSLLMLYPDGPDSCKLAVEDFMAGLKRRGGDYAAEVVNLAQSFPPELKSVPQLALLC
jgi:hypothetical protein